MKGVPIAEIARLLGHRDSRMTEQVYAKYAPEYLRRAIDALSAQTGPLAPETPAPFTLNSVSFQWSGRRIRTLDPNLGKVPQRLRRGIRHYAIAA